MLTSSGNADELHHAWTLRHLKKRSRWKPREKQEQRRTAEAFETAGRSKMKHPSVLDLLIFAFGWGSLFLCICSNARSSPNSDPGYGSIELDGRELKDQYTFPIRKIRGLENIRTDDYQPVDPSPSTKAAIRAGPIEHGTPILPYIPQYPPPPAHPEDITPAQSPGSPFT
ncbi:hypothetical protein ACP70R_017222 [Stipagrostis hirtigluma subsp. patula]